MNLVGLKLLVLSLRAHCPDQPLYIKCPVASPEFAAWLRPFNHVTFDTARDLPMAGYNVKPTLLKHCLAMGHKQVVWIDADILLHGDYRPLIDHVDVGTFVATEESYWARHQGSAIRTPAWGLRHARPLPGTINTCFMRITPNHRPLLDDWEALMTDRVYQQAQQKPAQQRPTHLMNDQDPLTALLGSDRYAHIPVHLIRRGTQIIHHAAAAGYTVSERLHNTIHGLPPLIHAMARKPWFPSTGYDRMHLQLSAYTQLAKRYRELLDEDTPWMDASDVFARVADGITRGHPCLRALPLAVGETIIRHLRRSCPGLRNAA